MADVPSEGTAFERTGAGAPAAAPEYKPGDHIGPYTLVRSLGRGGFGVVWLAEQSRPLHRLVALKLIRPGLSSPEVLARFEQEREALALMSHPNVARVYDAGQTPDGHPYFVMEYVRGIPITEYCDRTRLPLNERLRLLCAACEGVQHAHRHGIIHRDLKPSNILVTEEDGQANPKIIDFGIAKAVHAPIEERAFVSGEHQMIGTLEYMPPEQADPGPEGIDTRADVYALGVVLYELLVGAVPFDRRTLLAAGLNGMLRIICTVEPEKPSTRIHALLESWRTGSVPGGPGGVPAPEVPLGGTSGSTVAEIAEHRRTDPRSLERIVKGELDWITMKAMEKDRQRRYGSVTELAADLEHYLRQEPVEASPPSPLYRARKFIRRHAAAAAIVLVLALVLTASSIVSTSLYFRARSAQRAAVASAGEARTQAKAAEEAKERAEASAVAEQQAAYEANVRAAALSLRLGDVGACRASLDLCPSDLRGWEWRHLLATMNVSSASIPAGEIVHRFVLQENDSELLAVGDMTAARIAVPTGERADTLLAAVQLPDFAAQAAPLGVSPDGTRYLMEFLPDAGNCQVWLMNSADLKPVLRVAASCRESFRRFHSFAFSPSGALLALHHRSPGDGPGDEIAIFDLGRGALVARVPDAPCFAFSADGTRLFTGDDGLHVFSAADGAQIARTLASGGAGTIHCIAANPTGTRIATGGSAVIDLWSTENGARIASVGGRAESLLFTGDGAWLVAAVGSGLHVIDATDGRQVSVLRGHEDNVTTLAQGRDSRIVWSAARDRTIKRWDLARSDVLLAPPTLQRARVSRDSQLLLTVSYATWEGPRSIRITDAESGAVLSTVESRADDAAFSPDGETVATGVAAGRVELWQARSGQLTGEIVLPSPTPVEGAPEPLEDVLAFSPAGAHLGVLELVPGASRVHIIRMADRTIIASRDGVAQVLADLVWSPDGASLAFTNGPTLEVWDAALAVNRRTEELGTPVVSLAWNPAGTHLAGVSQEPGGRLRIWDLRSPGKPLDLPARLPRVWSVRWREPGDRIILAGAGLLRVFDPGTQRVMHAFEADGLITDLDMPGDGTAVYAVVKPKLGNPVVRRWQAAPVTP